MQAASAVISKAEARKAITDDFPRTFRKREVQDKFKTSSGDTIAGNCRHYWPVCHPGIERFARLERAAGSMRKIPFNLQSVAISS
jgi:hypothetical protein